MERYSFVGPQKELKLLQQLWTQTTAGSGQIVLIEGEPGIGKTPLVHRFSSDLEGCSRPVLWGRNYENQGVPPFWLGCGHRHRGLPTQTASRSVKSRCCNW